MGRGRVDLLAPAGGVFVWEAYGPDQLGQGTGGPQDAALLAPLEDVRRDVADGLVLHAWSGARPVREGSLHTGQGSVTQLIVRKPG